MVYFNDRHYYNVFTGEGNAPPYWWTAVRSPGFDWLRVALLFVILIGISILVVEGILLARKGKRKK